MLTLRRETDSDIAAIAAVVEAAFGCPDESFSVKAIRASAGFIADLSLVACIDGIVIGHVSVSRVTLQSNGSGFPILEGVQSIILT